MRSKKERVEELKRRITAMVEEVELDGLVLFVALSPDDRDPGDLAIPSFKTASGEHGHVAALVGDTFASLVLDYEHAVGSRSADVRAVLADTVVTSMRHCFGKFDQQASSDDEDEKHLGRVAGPHFIKKAGELVKRYLLVDDLRPLSIVQIGPGSALITVARTYSDAVEALLTQDTFDEAYLDHDLGCFGPDGREYTGYDLLCWLEQHPEKVPKKFVLVTSNPVGRQRMKQVIDRLQGKA